MKIITALLLEAVEELFASRSYDEKLSDSNDKDFEIEQYSVRKRFGPHEFSDLILTCLKKDRRFHTFDPEKVHSCSTFEVTAALCIAIIYSV